MEDTKALVRGYFHRLLNEKDTSVCDEVLAPDYVDHDAPESTPPGPASTKQFVSGFVRDYPDLSVEIKDIFSEGNKVAVRLVWRGTHRQSGSSYDRSGIVIVHFDENGQMTERWSAYT